MMTLRQLSVEHETIPTTTSWYLAELGEARGKQELFIKQSPQKLKVLREHALIESAVSSNRIEGVEVEKSRINTLIFGKPHLRDRNEEEVLGYREALKRIHEQGANVTLSEKTILELHRLCRGEIWDAGKYKEKNGDIIERQANGRTRIRFRTVPATEARAFVHELIGLWKSSLLFIIKSAYKEFEERLGPIRSPRGAKTEMIEAAINAFSGSFTMIQLEHSCPGVSRDMIRLVLRRLQKEGHAECLGRGPGASWRKKGNTSKKG